MHTSMGTTSKHCILATSQGHHGDKPLPCHLCKPAVLVAAVMLDLHHEMVLSWLAPSVDSLRDRTVECLVL
jgi:hypothetical protein